MSATTAANGTATRDGREVQDVRGESQVLALLRQSVNVTKISDATTWPVAAVRKLATREGLLVDQDGVPHPPDASPGQTAIARADLRELLRLAAASPDPKVKREIARLTAQLDQTKARLTAQLDQAKARLDQAKEIISGGRRTRTPATRRRYRPGVDYDTRQARAWVKANGHGALLPASGRWVPDEVIDAMRAAQHPSTDASQDASPEASQEVSELVSPAAPEASR